MPDTPQHKTTTGPSRGNTASNDNKGITDLFGAIGGGLQRFFEGVAASQDPVLQQALVAKRQAAQTEEATQVFLEGLFSAPPATPDAPPTSRGLGAGGQPFDFNQGVLGIQTPALPSTVSAPTTPTQFQERAASGQARKPPPRARPTSKAQQISAGLPAGASIKIPGPGGTVAEFQGQGALTAQQMIEKGLQAGDQQLINDGVEAARLFAGAKNIPQTFIAGALDQLLNKGDRAGFEFLKQAEIDVRTAGQAITNINTNINQPNPVATQRFFEEADFGTILDNISSTFDPAFFGGLQRTAENLGFGEQSMTMRDVMGFTEGGEVAFDAAVRNIGDFFARDRTGAVIGPEERPTFRAIIPSRGDSVRGFLEKKMLLNANREAFGKRIAAFLSAQQQGRAIPIEELQSIAPFVTDLREPEVASRADFMELVRAMGLDAVLAQGIITE